MTNHKYIDKCVRWLAAAVVEDVRHDSVSKQLNEKFTKCYDAISNAIDWDTLTLEDVKELGFMGYGENEDEYDCLWLIPMWLYPAVPEGVALQMRDTNREFYFNRKTASCRNFYGCLEYGIRVAHDEVNND